MKIASLFVICAIATISTGCTRLREFQDSIATPSMRAEETTIDLKFEDGAWWYPVQILRQEDYYTLKQRLPEFSHDLNKDGEIDAYTPQSNRKYICMTREVYNWLRKKYPDQMYIELP